MADEILYEKLGGGVAIVTLNRPEKRNAVNPELTLALDAVVKAAEADPDVRVVVLASSNDRSFCAGADLAAVAEGGGKDLLTPDGGFAGFVHHPRRKPWIAAVRGLAIGGGCELCLACDMIVCGETTRFGLPEPQLGLVAAAGGASRLPRTIPRNVAVEMIVTGDSIDASRAYALGLANRVVPAERVLDEALVLARRIAANAPLAVQEGLALARTTAFMDAEAAREAARAALDRLGDTEDFKEGPQAFLEKRAPVWKGR